MTNQQTPEVKRLPMWSLSLGLIFAIFSSLAGTASSQISGTELCACSPRVYELTFDFSLECEPINVDLESGGINDATCLVAGFDNINVTDLIPVAVSSVQLIEIGQDGGPAAVAQETGDFRDGDTVTYTSISFEGAVAPRAFQVRALGRNDGGEPLVLTWAVTYSNNCGVFPVLQVNDSVGWTIFTGLARPVALVCPAAALPTFAPTGMPITPAPTELDETPAPTPDPTPEPTTVPGTPTTGAPTIPPVPMPVAPPTEPEMSMSMSYSFSFDWDSWEDEELEFGREEEKRKGSSKAKKCRKSKVRKVRRVRKTRALQGKNGKTTTPKGRQDDTAMMSSNDDPAMMSSNDDPAMMAGSSSDMAESSTDAAQTSGDEMSSMDASPAVSGDDMAESSSGDEYVDVVEYEEVEVCDDEVASVDESSSDDESPSIKSRSSGGKAGGKAGSKGGKAGGKGGKAGGKAGGKGLAKKAGGKGGNKLSKKSKSKSRSAGGKAGMMRLRQTRQ